MKYRHGDCIMASGGYHGTKENLFLSIFYLYFYPFSI